jgi:hypothetical protein
LVVFVFVLDLVVAELLVLIVVRLVFFVAPGILVVRVVLISVAGIAGLIALVAMLVLNILVFLIFMMVLFVFLRVRV